MASRAQITRSRAAWKACEGIRAADQIGGSVSVTRRSPSLSVMLLVGMARAYLGLVRCEGSAEGHSRSLAEVLVDLHRGRRWVDPA